MVARHRRTTGSYARAGACGFCPNSNSTSCKRPASKVAKTNRKFGGSGRASSVDWSSHKSQTATHQNKNASVSAGRNPKSPYTRYTSSENNGLTNSRPQTTWSSDESCTTHKARATATAARPSTVARATHHKKTSRLPQCHPARASHADANSRSKTHKPSRVRGSFRGYASWT